MYIYAASSLPNLLWYKQMLFQSLCQVTLSEAALTNSSRKKKLSNHTINSKENDQELFQNKLHGPNRVVDCFKTALCER